MKYLFALCILICAIPLPSEKPYERVLDVLCAAGLGAALMNECLKEST